MQFPVAIELRRSAWLSLLVGSVHAIAAGGLLTLPWPWWLRASIILALGLSAGRFLLQSPPVVSLVLASKSELRCKSVDGRASSLQVLPDSTVFDQLIVLRVRVGEERKISTIVLMPDQITGEQFRMLRLWLRWQGPIEGSSSAS